ncbi:hypothetical protein Hanom_Chr15g01383871 [Helianthus anomalus]
MSLGNRALLGDYLISNKLLEHQVESGYEARRYGDITSLEDHPPRRRHVIVLPRMLYPPKVEGMGRWS